MAAAPMLAPRATPVNVVRSFIAIAMVAPSAAPVVAGEKGWGEVAAAG